MRHQTTNSYLHIKILLVLITVSVLTGCDVLEQEPRGQLTTVAFFESKEHALHATNATYQILRTYSVHALPWLALTDIASDDAVKGSVPADAPSIRRINDFTFSASNPNFESTWNAYYKGIFRANFAIEGIPDVEELEPALEKRLIGENKFLRAYFYFFLVRAYGGVPLILKTLEVGQGFNAPRASIDSVYTQIEQDLQYAIEVLPPKSGYSAADAGRVTKGAAKALLARVHLFQEEYDKAEALALSVIQSGEYSLYPDYWELFRLPGENSSGSVFAVQAVALETGAGGTQYSQVQGVRGQPNLGWGFNKPSINLLQAYEPGDPRLQATILFVNEILPNGENTVRDNAAMAHERYSQKPFNPVSAPGGIGASGVNIRRIRYADVLLIAAEAAYYNGHEGRARKFVNQVRARARERNATIGIQPEGLSPVIADTIGLISETESPIVRYIGANSPAVNELKPFNFELKLIDGSSTTLVKNVDIIQKIDGQAVNSLEEYLAIMETKEVGESLTLSVLRVTQTLSGGAIQTDTQTLSVTITTIALLPDVTASGRELLEAIWHERRVELAMEQHRFWNIQRQERAAEILQSLGINYVDGKNDLYPIPQHEVDIAGLEQNPGY